MNENTTTVTNTPNTTNETVDFTPILEQLKYNNEIQIVQTGFIFALLVALAFHLVLSGGFKR